MSIISVVSLGVGPDRYLLNPWRVTTGTSMRRFGGIPSGRCVVIARADAEAKLLPALEYLLLNPKRETNDLSGYATIEVEYPPNLKDTTWLSVRSTITLEDGKFKFNAIYIPPAWSTYTASEACRIRKFPKPAKFEQELARLTSRKE